jgi:hypothetical protein
LYNDTKSQNDDDLSMDEILASIRRYVVDEQQAAQTSINPAPHIPTPNQPFTRDNYSPPASNFVDQDTHSPQHQPIPVVRLTAAHEVKEFAQQQPLEPKFESRNSSDASSPTILSANVVEAAAQSLHKLKETAKVDKQETSASSSQSVEHFIVSLMKPLIKRWLDENLPSLVERMVQKEIQKITSNLE